MLQEKLITIEAKAAQVVIAKILDLVPNADGVVVLTSEDVDDLQSYINEAVTLDPTNDEAIAAAVLLLRAGAVKSGNEKFLSFASKVEQLWEVISDLSLGTIGKIANSIGILFQSKKRAIEKL